MAADAAAAPPTHLTQWVLIFIFYFVNWLLYFTYYIGLSKYWRTAGQQLPHPSTSGLSPWWCHHDPRSSALVSTSQMAQQKEMRKMGVRKTTPAKMKATKRMTTRAMTVSKTVCLFFFMTFFYFLFHFSLRFRWYVILFFWYRFCLKLFFQVLLGCNNIFLAWFFFFYITLFVSLGSPGM